MRHTGTLKSARLSKLMEAFQTYRIMGKKPTTIELQEYTLSCNISADIADARTNGIDIKCNYLGEFNGRRVSEFYIKPKVEMELA